MLALFVITVGDIIGLGLLGILALAVIGFGLYKVGNAIYWWLRRL